MTGDSQTGVKPNLSADDLISSLPQLAQMAELEVKQLVQKPSGALTISDIAKLAAGVRDAVKRGIDGVVVIQGTDTIEETAFALDLMIQASCPVVITGAMRNPSMAGSDGPANLVAAISAASYSAFADYGVIVAFDNELHLACHVAKQDSIKGDAFKSPLCGPVGRIVEDRVVLFSRPFDQRIIRCELHDLLEVPPVALLISSMNDDGRLVTAAVDAGYKAIVLAAMGAGHVPPEVADRLEQAALVIPVVFCSRSPGGQVCKQTYGYIGGEIDLLQRGLISGGWLAPLKAKILTTLALAQGPGKEEISMFLQAYDGGAR
ncbi:MAG: asparaginase [Gammaproteobacteria bacterium]|nr:asparaginase [Gammaproteobacteria bacterium]